MSSYHVEGFHRNTGRAGLWTYRKRKLFLNEQKDCNKQSRGTKDN